MKNKLLAESPNRLVLQTVWPFVFIVSVLLIAMVLSLELMSSVRAYVGGESLYSKAQKQAYISLVNYLRSHSTRDYQDFLANIAVPLGDHRARLAMDQRPPDRKAAYEGLIAGRNRPDDVPGMIRLYLYFKNTPLMKEPIRIWSQADMDILRLLALGQSIHQKIQTGRLDEAVRLSLIQELRAVDLHITPLEEAFSTSIAEVSHQIEKMSIIFLVGLTVLLMGLGLVFSRRLAYQRVLSAQALRKEYDKNVAFLRNASDGIYILDSAGNIQEASDSFCAMLGYTRNEIIGMHISQWDAHFKPKELPDILQSHIDKSIRSQFETVHRRKDGSLFDVEISVIPIVLDGVSLLFNSSRDISERKRNEQQVEHLAYHDQLTGLPNRTLLLDRLSQAIASSRRYKRFGAIFFVDLDKFKTINDVHGHIIGDQVLKEVATRLSSQMRRSDTVSRFGGDEFVILLSELSSDQEQAAKFAFSVAEQIRAALERPVPINSQDYIITSSIGVSLFPKEDATVEDMIREADIAMYRAKENGRNALVFFEHDMQAHIAERYSMERDLRNALRNNQLELHLQSQVDKTNTIIGAEALVRWRHPARGLIMPAGFITLAEETGLIVQIGEWVLREACRLNATLHSLGSKLRIAVNVSPRQFHQVNFVNRVKEIIDETGANPLYLTFEVTENLLIDRTPEAVSSMFILSKLGIRFSIDDFGTGYSSLSYLKRLPLNELKIDKSFVQELPQDDNDVALIETILSMSHHLGFEVVAEGVETEVQYEFLARQGCEYFQGYYFHRPQPAQTWLEQLLREDQAKAGPE